INWYDNDRCTFLKVTHRFVSKGCDCGLSQGSAFCVLRFASKLCFATAFWRMIATTGEPDIPVLVPETFHEQTDEELTENDIKQMDADDQAI
nr:hypothetical protein [Tanacetum cinerariifolium]